MSFELHAVKTPPRFLTVSESMKYYPRIVLSGAWLAQWAFTPGDRPTALFVAAGHMLVKVVPSQAAKPETLPILNNRRSHPLTVSTNSTSNTPQITITGAWLRDWGFCKGDLVSVAKEDHSVMAISLKMHAEKWRIERMNIEQKREESRIHSLLKQYKAEYPDIFQQVANPPKKHITKLRPVQPNQPSLFDQIMAATREYNADIAARSTTPFRG